MARSNIPERAQKASERLNFRINARLAPVLMDQVQEQAGGNLSEFVRAAVQEKLVKAEHKGGGS